MSTNIKKLYAWNSIFKKRISNMKFWIIVQILVPVNLFRGLLQGVIVNFISSASHGGRHLLIPPPFPPPPPPTLKNFLLSCLKWNHSSCCSRKWPHRNFVMWFSFLTSSIHLYAWSNSYCYYLFNFFFMVFCTVLWFMALLFIDV